MNNNKYRRLFNNITETGYKEIFVKTREEAEKIRNGVMNIARIEKADVVVTTKRTQDDRIKVVLRLLKDNHKLSMWVVKYLTSPRMNNCCAVPKRDIRKLGGIEQYEQFLSIVCKQTLNDKHVYVKLFEESRPYGEEKEIHYIARLLRKEEKEDEDLEV